MSWYIAVFKKYAVFHGRAQRKEFWTFFFVNIIILAVLTFVDEVLLPSTEGSFASGFWLTTSVPYVAVGVRRMHDTDHSGWWLLVPFINVVLAALEGEPGANRFGPDPKLGPSGAGSRFVSPTDSAYAVCSRCGFEQWQGYTKCQKCGVEFQQGT